MTEYEQRLTQKLEQVQTELERCSEEACQYKSKLRDCEDTMRKLQEQVLSNEDKIYLNGLLDDAILEQQSIEAKTAKEIVEYADRPDENGFRVSVKQNRVAAKTREKLQNIQNRINEGGTK